MNEETTPTGPRSHWGRSRFGGSSRTLLVTCLLAGNGISLLLGWVITLLQPEHAGPGLFAIGAIATLPVSCIAVWALLIDRTTLTGAPDDPESSIEGQWLDRAAGSSFTDLIAIIGLGCAVFTFVELPISTGLAFGGLFGIAALDFFLRYQLIKRREG